MHLKIIKIIIKPLIMQMQQVVLDSMQQICFHFSADTHQVTITINSDTIK